MPNVTPKTESGREVPGLTAEGNELYHALRQTDPAWVLADDPVWGPLYRDLVRDRYAQFHKVLVKHRPAIEQEAASAAVAEVLVGATKSMRVSADDIRKALANLRGPVDRDESIVMACAQAILWEMDALIASERGT